MRFKFLRYILILGITVLLIYQISAHIDELKTLPSLFISAKKPFIFLAFTAYLFQYVSDGLLSKILLQILGYRLKLLNTFRLAIVDVFAAQILPLGQAGAVVTSFYFYKKMGVLGKDIVFLSFFWTILTSFALAILGIASLLFLPLHKAIPIPHESFSLYWVLILISIIFGVILSIFILFRKEIHKFCVKFSPFKIIKRNEVSVLNHKILMGAAFVCAIFYYLMQATILFASLASFGVYPEISVIIFCLAISLILTSISLIPGGIGVAEVSLVALLLLFNLPASSVFAGVLLYRIFSFWIPLIFGGITYFSLRKSPLH